MQGRLGHKGQSPGPGLPPIGATAYGLGRPQGRSLASKVVTSNHGGARATDCEQRQHLPTGKGNHRLRKGDDVELPINLTIPGLGLPNLTSDCSIGRLCFIPFVPKYFVHPIGLDFYRDHLGDDDGRSEELFYF
ncbi:hypothetical protein BHE74_00018965 [Ensete ventricosum]|nr:hypothetical protein BHE74_00018965 [Ensete ventricosum]